MTSSEQLYDYIEKTRQLQRKLMEEASEVIMTRAIPGNDPLSPRAAMLPELKAEGDG